MISIKLEEKNGKLLLKFGLTSFDDATVKICEYPCSTCGSSLIRRRTGCSDSDDEFNVNSRCLGDNGYLRTGAVDVLPRIWWGAFFPRGAQKVDDIENPIEKQANNTLVVERPQVSCGAYVSGGVAPVKNAGSVQARPTTNPRKPCVFHCRFRNEL